MPGQAEVSQVKNFKLGLDPGVLNYSGHEPDVFDQAYPVNGQLQLQVINKIDELCEKGDLKSQTNVRAVKDSTLRFVTVTVGDSVFQFAGFEEDGVLSPKTKSRSRNGRLYNTSPVTVIGGRIVREVRGILARAKLTVKKVEPKPETDSTAKPPKTTFDA